MTTILSSSSTPSTIQIKEEKCVGRTTRNVSCDHGHRSNPIVIDLSIEDGGSSSQGGKKMGSSFVIPISFVNPIGSYLLLGSPNQPICVEDDEVEISDDRKQSIPVDNYLDVECFEIGPFDPKGKRPKRERRSGIHIVIEDAGESSKPPPMKPDAYCTICMEPKFKYECLLMKKCTHLYCVSCVAQYVQAKVEENVASIGCPDPGCKDGYLEPGMCQNVLKPEVFNRWGIALYESLIGSMRFYCPYKDCSALLIDEREVSSGAAIMTAECPHCFRLFCAQCKVPWHAGMSCEEFSKLAADERSTEDIMLKKMAEDNKWQRCPKCKFYVEKVSGCMFITCRCGFKFCYGCATEMTIDHYCQQCRR